LTTAAAPEKDATMEGFSFSGTVLILLLMLSAVGAQPQRRTPARTPAPKPTPVPSPQPPAAQPAPVRSAEISPLTLAIVNDTTITAGDIQGQVYVSLQNTGDLFLLGFYEDREKAIKEARQRALDAHIGSLLAAAEAKKRGLSTEDFLDREVNGRVAPPAEAEIVAAYNANRAQIGNTDLETMRPQLINYLRNQKIDQLYTALINRLKMTNTVMRHVDVNTPNLAAGTVLAAVNGEPIRVEAINERMKAYVFKMESQIYAAQIGALDRRINDLLLIDDANKRHVGSDEIVRTEITDKLKPPTDAEVAKFYEDNKARIEGDLAANRAAIAELLQQQQQHKLEIDLATKLRASAKVQIFLKEPEPLVMNVTAASGPSRGDVNSLVTIIEFTDFQCAACGAMYPVIEDVLKSYGARVHFVIRDFPLTKLHPNAFRAAQAASAANAQGKFWEYIDILFRNQNSLDAESLKKFATQIGLDRKRFDAEFDSGKYDAEIRRDIADGEMYGVEGTPAIFINGIALQPAEFSADGFRAAIERAFARASKRVP
jgi:protein-disulfide isomerase